MEKKQAITLGVIVLIVAAGIGIGVYFVLPKGPSRTTLVVGVGSGPIDLEPQFAWDSASVDVIDQVCEGLFTYDLAQPNTPLIPRLASDFGTWTVDELNYTVPLRNDVLFHDGTAFNASAVKFTFDRLQYLLDNHLTQIAELYEYYEPTEDKFYQIINTTEVVDTYTVKFVLNKPYGPFVDLLTFVTSYILSPTSTPATELIKTASGDIVGTGPFVYDGYEAGVEVNFHSWEQYYRPPPSIKTLTFSVIEDTAARQVALVTGDVDLLPGPWPAVLDLFESDPGVSMIYGGQTSATGYLGMNNLLIPVELREAISYALDYDYIIENIYYDQGVRLTSPIPAGVPYHNDTLDYPIYNVTYARQVIVDSASYSQAPTNLTDDAAWLALTDDTDPAYDPIASYNYSYNIDNEIRADIGELLMDWLPYIGIEVVDAGSAWGEFVRKLYEISPYSRNDLALYYVGWIPDYNDPSNFINPLFTNRSVGANGAQFNDPEVQVWMEEALFTANETLRESLYQQIQEKIVEELYPWALCMQGVDNNAYNAGIKTGPPTNVMGKLYLYPVEWA